MKKLLIVTGPQGSGNHLWSKIFALHTEVYGWKDLLDTYWIGHDQEPFAHYWKYPAQLHKFDWTVSDYYVASVSIPYMDNGTATVPNFEEFIQELHKLNIVVQVAVIGRDQNILKEQQKRVRDSKTLSLALAEVARFTTVDFLSYELLHLYKETYLKELVRTLSFPIDYNNTGLKEILADDTNSKYITPVEHYWVDDLAKEASRKKHE
jgi:hypothetical protein